MPGRVSGGHPDETTLLRLVVSDLPLDERKSAERHLGRCASCRGALEASKQLDGALRKAGPGLAAHEENAQALPEGDPFAHRPAGDGRRATDIGLDPRALVQESARAVPAAHELARRFLSKFSDDEQRRTVLGSIDLDVLRDRLALAYTLDELLDAVEESPTLRRRQAHAVLALLNGEGKGPASKAASRTAAAFAMPIADLRGRAHLLSGAAASWSGDLEVARREALSAWTSFAEGRLSEPLLARVEIFEALRRIAEGRAADAMALVRRASSTFSISAHEVDVAREGLVSGLAEWDAGQLSEAAVLLRKSALGFRRAGAWSGSVTAACAAALCLAAGGRVEESRRAFRDLRRRKARLAPLPDRMFVRETERIALLSTRRPSKGKKAAVAFSAADAVLLRGASVLGESIVAAARESDERLEVVVAELHDHPACGFALLYACQKGSLLVVQDPLRALEMARSIFEEAKTTVDASIVVGPSRLALREVMQAEAKLLESQAHVELGYARDSITAAEEARNLFRSAGDPGFGFGLADYYHGQAAIFARDYVNAEILLKKAQRAFSPLDHDNLMARAATALGTLYVHQGEEERSLSYFDHAIELFDPVDDTRFLTASLVNRGAALCRLRRFQESRVSLTRALNCARTLGSAAQVAHIRAGFGEIHLQRGDYARALRTFQRLASDERRLGWRQQAFVSDLYVGECFGRLGRQEEMARVIRTIREEVTADPFAGSRVLEELFAVLGQGALDADMVARVRSYLEGGAIGISRACLRVEMAGSVAGFRRSSAGQKGVANLAPGELRRDEGKGDWLADRMFIRETERIALLLGRASPMGKKGSFQLSASEQRLARDAAVLADGVVAAARESDENLSVALADLRGKPSCAFALLYACQKGNLLVAQDPLRALELSRAVFEEAESLPGVNVVAHLSTLAGRETVQAEARLLKSASQVQLGYAIESRTAAVEAREFFRAGGDVGFGLALADYYEGQAAGFARDYIAGGRLLRKATKVFAGFGQSRWAGRAKAALGTLIMQRGDDNAALPCFEDAIEMLDPTEDAKPLASTLNNRAQVLRRLRRFDDARACYARALTLARKLDAQAAIQTIRNGLAELDFQRGHYDRALRAFSELSGVAHAANWKMEQLFAELYVAECLGRLGREEEMAEKVIALRAACKSNPFAVSPAMEELFHCLSRGVLDTDLVAHVRAYLEDEAKGIERPHARLKIVG